MPPPLTDEIILNTFEARGTRAMTYVIKNRLNRVWTTEQVRRKLRDMEKRGLVRQTTSVYATQLCWQVIYPKESL